MASNKLVGNVAELAVKKLYDTRAKFHQTNQFINCKNGELHWVGDSWDFRPQHLREHRAITQIQTTYDSSATCRVFDRYLSTAFGDDADGNQKKQLLLEMMGYSLWPCCAYEKFAILFGVPASGKSVFLRLLQELVGVESCTAAPLSELKTDKGRGQIIGKLLHVVSELGTQEKIPDGPVRQLSSGDLMSGKHLYKDPFNFTPTSTLWIATNSMPYIADRTGAVLRRIALIEFERPVPAGMVDPELGTKLKTELPGILNRALEAFGAVMQRRGQFTQPNRSELALMRLGGAGSSIARFVKQCCTLDKQYKIDFEVFYDTYNCWAEKEGEVALSRNKITARLKAEFDVDGTHSGDTRKLRGISIHQDYKVEVDYESPVSS
jgi:putative DNA primase/helicase